MEAIHLIHGEVPLRKHFSTSPGFPPEESNIMSIFPPRGVRVMTILVVTQGLFILEHWWLLRGVLFTVSPSIHLEIHDSRKKQTTLKAA